MTISTKRVIFPIEDGGVGILLPGTGWEPMDAAKKDIPAGVPFRIVEMEDIPEKDETRNQWSADFTNPDGYGEKQE